MVQVHRDYFIIILTLNNLTTIITLLIKRSNKHYILCDNNNEENKKVYKKIIGYRGKNWILKKKPLILIIKKMKNQVIKSLNLKMGKEIIKYFQSLGVDTKNYTGSVCLFNIYYGVINGRFNHYFLNDVKKANAEIIELPIFPKRGDRILVWDDVEKYAIESIFLTFIEGAIQPIIAVSTNDTNLYTKDKPFLTVNWKNWKPIEKEVIVELTLEDISNGKGVGIKPHLIKIKQ